MSKSKDYVFIGLHIMAWIIFVGLSIEAGALLVNFIYSMFNPSVVKNLYQKMDLSQLYAQSPPVFYGMYIVGLVIAFMKAYLFYELIRLIMKLDLAKPFSEFAGKQIMKISYATFNIGLLSYIAKEVSQHYAKRDFDMQQLNQFWVDSQAYILMAGVIFVIAQIFKKGIELQTENDLTV